ncbi:DsbA family protein [Halopiger aswanensis]|uniref:DSBA-like thioredoxin domain-containing protein n=1 Tax=Halopiger aswanensis TaxID=148449 RepID=A0A3R7DDN5_9EURY|nr:DsbA family protein [Halopiger aswanensis]RKD95607.1 DSBA-like thioredoxin domain-containing protein [Halopiger aswanensis]
MFVFLGSYSGGDYDSSDSDDSQNDGSTDDHTQTGVDDYTGDDGDDNPEEDSDSAAGAAAGVADAAGAAAGAAGGGAGGSAGAAAGAGAGAGAVTEPPEGDDPGDTDETDEDEDCEEEEEEQPEPPDIEEPDIDPEDDVDEPDTEEDTEEDVDESEDVEEDTEEEDSDDEAAEDEEQESDEDNEEDEDEEEDETVVVVQEVDALSAMSWCVQPVMKRVEECYGEEIELFYKPAPVREVDPEQEKQKWIDAGQQLGMPVDPSFWEDDPPMSTELVNKAFEAADRQRRGMDYLRALWRHGVAAGRDINDEDVLVDLASDLGLDRERFEEDLDEVELESGGRGELPFTFMEIQGAPVPKNGRVRYSDFRTQFTFQGVEEQEPQDLQGFVEEHGPVATPEVMEVYGIRREEAVQRLQDVDGVSSFEAGGEDFWC